LRHDSDYGRCAIPGRQWCGGGQGQGGGRKGLKGSGGIQHLQLCLLVLLHEGEGYGYSLSGKLAQFGFDEGAIDISVIYRALRGLEEQGLIRAEWDEKSLGPQRRVYSISQEGEAVLEVWMEGVRTRMKELEALDAAFRKTREEKNKQEADDARI